MVDEARHAKLRSQREPPPYFAGRAKELAALNERLDDLCETGDPTGGMALIVGVPGVGKTQLARKFAEDATRREGQRRISWLELNTRTLKAADLIVFMDMMKALGQERAGRKVADIQPNTSRVGVGALSAKVDVSREHVRHAHDLTSLMRDSLHRGLWRDQALVITIDELQAVDAVGIETLRALHLGEHGCPVLVLGVGLQHTQLVLGNPGDAMVTMMAMYGAHAVAISLRYAVSLIAMLQRSSSAQHSIGVADAAKSAHMRSVGVAPDTQLRCCRWRQGGSRIGRLDIEIANMALRGRNGTDL